MKRVCELLAQCVAEAMALDMPVRRDVYSAAATLDGWAKDLARRV
jgi:hypothetical protein